jgi:hypothetical protein
MKLGIFYQSGHKREATYYSLERLRMYYPNIPVVLYEDGGSDILKEISDKFNCIYKRTEIIGENYLWYGKPVYDLISGLDYLNRIYNECISNLKDCEWIMHYEDDVWIERKIEGIPPYDLNGISSFYINEDLKKHIGSRLDRNYGVGGSIFNRQAFIDCYDDFKEIDWDVILKLDKSVVEWSDQLLTFYFDYSKRSIGSWSELCNTKPPPYNVIHEREKWMTRPQEVDIDTINASIIHGYKGYYFPSEEEINYVNNKLWNKN